MRRTTERCVGGGGLVAGKTISSSAKTELTAWTDKFSHSTYRCLIHTRPQSDPQYAIVTYAADVRLSCTCTVGFVLTHQERKRDDRGVEQAVKQLQIFRPPVQIRLSSPRMIDRMKSRNGEVEAHRPPCQKGEVAERLADHLPPSDDDVRIDVDIAEGLSCMMAGLPCVGDHDGGEDIDGNQYSNTSQNGWRDNVGSNE